MQREPRVAAFSYLGLPLSGGAPGRYRAGIASDAPKSLVQGKWRESKRSAWSIMSPDYAQLGDLPAGKG